MDEVDLLGPGRALGEQVGGEVGPFLLLYFGEVVLGWRCGLAFFGHLQGHCFVVGPRGEEVAAGGLLFLGVLLEIEERLPEVTILCH